MGFNMDRNSSKVLNLRFKGNRRYIHGSDIYNSINSLSSIFTGKPSSYVSRLVFRAFAYHDCDICIHNLNETRKIIATGTIADNAGTETPFWIFESDRAVNERYEFNESLITSSSYIHETCISITHETGFTAIENFISLSKELNYHLYPNILGKWVFGQLDLYRPFSDHYDMLSVQLKSAFRNQFTVSNLYQNNVNIGEIRFIVGQP